MWRCLSKNVESNPLSSGPEPSLQGRIRGLPRLKPRALTLGVRVGKERLRVSEPVSLQQSPDLYHLLSRVSAGGRGVLV